MQTAGEFPRKTMRALLCLNDIDTDLVLKTRIFGQPLLYHLFRTLYSCGISEVALSVETVVPELLALIDRLNADGLEPIVLRKGVDALQFAGKPGACLLQNAAIWVARELVEKISAADGKVLLTLAENQHYSLFERIDLNRRWAGIAVLDGTLAASSPPISEGWSIDSCLLRAALQAGYADMLLSDEAATQVLHSRCENPEELARLIGAGLDARPASNRQITELADSAIQKFAAAHWWQGTIDLVAPAIAISSALSAFFSYPTIALSLATIALLGREIRARWRQVSYLRPTGDLIDYVTLGLLLLSLYLGLGIELSPLDAAFLTNSLVGILALGQLSRHVIPKALISPWIVAASLAFASISGHLAAGAKIAITILIGWLIAGQLRHEG
jgi:hypothetical protein